MLKNKVIICLSGTNWALPRGIAQRAMERLALSNRVFFVEYQPSFLHCVLKSISHTDYGYKNRGAFYEKSPNITLYSPKPGLPFNHYLRCINKLNTKAITKVVRPIARRYGPRNTIFWVFVPSLVDCARNFRDFFIVYHCGGNYALEKNNLLRKINISRMEKEMTELSDLVVAQTRSLCDRFASLGKKTFYLPSAIDYNDFRNKSEKPDSSDTKFKEIKRPRIGIIGYFDDSFYDTELLNYLTERRPGWSFVFIGPVTGKAKRIAGIMKKRNAFFLGQKSRHEIPANIKEIDVGLIPYKVNNYMKEVSPNKFYEYIACGKPVVSSDIPDIARYDGAVKIAKRKAEFISHIEDLLAADKNNISAREKIRKIARDNSIDIYMNNLSEVIENIFNEKMKDK